MYSINTFPNQRISPKDSENNSQALANYLDTIQKLLVSLNDVNYINLCLDFQLLYYLMKVKDNPNKDILYMILNDISINLLLIDNIDKTLEKFKEIPENNIREKCKNNRKIFAVHDVASERRNKVCKYTRNNRIGKCIYNKALCPLNFRMCKILRYKGIEHVHRLNVPLKKYYKGRSVVAKVKIRERGRFIKSKDIKEF
jgi:hypothetical protein